MFFCKVLVIGGGDGGVSNKSSGISCSVDSGANSSGGSSVVTATGAAGAATVYMNECM